MIDIENEQIMKYERVNVFCLVYLSAWALLPQFAYYTSGTIFKMIYGAITIVWIITGIANIKRKYIKYIFSMLCFFGIMLLYSLLEYGNLRLVDFINYILLFGIGINSSLYVTRISIKRRDKLKIFLLACITITMSTTLITLIDNPNAARALTSSSTNEDIIAALTKSNVGAFDFIYGIIILFPTIILLLERNKKIKIKLVYIIISILIIVCLIKSNFTTGYVLFCVEIMLIVFPKSKSWKAKIMSIAAIMLILILGPYIIRSYLSFLSSTTTSIYSKEKIEAILGVFNGTSEISETTGRINLMKQDLVSFFENPIFGVGAYYGVASGQSIGQHSQLLDELARYGLFGAIPLFYFIYGCIKILWCVLKSKENRNDLFIPTVIFLALSILNPVFNNGILMCYFIVAPIILGGENKNENMLYT